MRKLSSRFLRNRNGNFGMMLAFAMPALMASVAFGVDISNTLSIKTEMQDANDAAVLLAARYFKEYRKHPPMATIQAFLDGNSAISITAKKLTFNKARTEFTLESKTKVNTYLMGYFSKKDQEYSSISKANLGFSETLDFVLSLDTTFSMSADGKMNALKLAAHDFIDTMFDAKDRGADINGGIVPFAQYVNVGVGRKGESWLSVPKDIDTRVTTSVCGMVSPVIGQTNCRSEYTPPQTINHSAASPVCSTNDGVASCTSGNAAWTENMPGGNANVCDNVYGPAKNECNDVTTGSLVTWQGYVGSRAYPLNVQDKTYSKKIPGLLDVVGSVELQTLTDDRMKLKNKIDELIPSGETYIPEGVIWGTRVLTKQAPFTEAKTTGKGGRPIRRALVVMTDGDNTLSPDGAFHTNKDEALADTYTAEACDEAKAQKLEVFTISFGTSIPNSMKDLLEACATLPTQYFHAANAAQLKLAFENIANEMLSVRLSQ